MLVDGVEMDRHTVDSLLIKEETVRDGEALTQQLSTDVFSVSLFIIALASVSFGLYAMVLRRRMLAPESEEELADQTDVVAEDMKSGKAVPTCATARTDGTHSTTTGIGGLCTTRTNCGQPSSIASHWPRPNKTCTRSANRSS